MVSWVWLLAVLVLGIVMGAKIADNLYKRVLSRLYFENKHLRKQIEDMANLDAMKAVTFNKLVNEAFRHTDASAPHASKKL